MSRCSVFVIVENGIRVEPGLCVLARREGLFSGAEVSSERVVFLWTHLLSSLSPLFFPPRHIPDGSQCLNFLLANLLQPCLLH